MWDCILTDASLASHRPALTSHGGREPIELQDPVVLHDGATPAMCNN